jgi:glucosamine--fructose-6-phosphate aminotransferase (isomerizing)
LKGARHIFLCGEGLGDCIAKEGALKMKELTYLHCQSINLTDLGNNFYCYLKNHPKSPIIFIILDKHPNKTQMIEFIEKLLP